MPLFFLLAGSCGPAGKERPNILWITSEDNGPQLGAYGDTFATTPSLDKLAASGVIYMHAWSNAPVCAPARTTIISGMYPTSTGSEHMRSMTRLPDGMRMFPAYLREAGYYTSNNSKEDYNLEKAPDVWDDSSTKAHWRNGGDDPLMLAEAVMIARRMGRLDPQTAPHACARPCQSAHSRLSSRHARKPPGLGAVLRQDDGDGRAGR